jgi:hypothetical protein
MPIRNLPPELERKLRETNREIADSLATALPPGTGFLLMTFPFGGNGPVTYVSNADRGCMIKTLSDYLEKLKKGLS